MQHRLLTLAGLSLALTASVVAPTPARAAVGVFVRVGPAPRVVEVPPPAPRVVWVGGFWNWTGARYVWVPGHDGYPPAPATHWVPAHDVAGPYGWYSVPGHWAP